MNPLTSRLPWLPIMLSACLLSACATTTRPLAPDQATQAPGEGYFDRSLLQADATRTVAVTLVREVGHVGSRMGTVAMVDGVPIVLLLAGQKTTVFLAPGPHRFAMGYAKHLETRPLIQSRIDVPAQGPLEVAFRLRLGREPAFVVRRADEPPFVFEDYDADVQRSGAAVQSPSWSDLGNLEEYAEPSEVAGIVDGAIASAARRDWWRGNVGRSMDGTRRYVYTRRQGWIDLKHVISTASNPGAFVPGASWLASFGVEVAQVFVAPMSAFLPEDHVSNSMGASAAMQYLFAFGRGGTRGERVQAKIDRLQPLTREQAFARFGIDPGVRARADSP